MAAGTCTQGPTTSTVTLTGLTPGTSYTFTAYSNATCTTEIARVAFTTLGAPPAPIDPPTFGTQTISAPEYLEGTAIEPLTLPAATGGNGQLTLYRDAEAPGWADVRRSPPRTRTLSGTPTAAQAATRYTYTVTDRAGRQATLPFTLTVAADLKPTFGTQTISAPEYLEGTAIEPLTLPAATGGNGQVDAIP